MIIKSMPRKSISFGQLLDYINGPEHTGPAIMQNLHAAGDDMTAIHHEFVENARLLPPRRNGNMLYHEILSASDLDRKQATPTILGDIARKYLELRAPYALAYGRVHLDTDCPHVHLMISANNVGSSRRIRVSRSRFAGIKRELEAYQRDRYPLLEHSLVETGGKRAVPAGRARQQPKLSRAESERARRQQRQDLRRSPSQKERIRQTVLEQLTVARSGTAFFLDLKARGLWLYRRGQAVSVKDLASGRRYRLRTLGLEESFTAALRQWKALPERLQSLCDLELNRAQELRHEQGFREEIRAVLESSANSKQPEPEQARFDQSRPGRSHDRHKHRSPQRDS